MTPLNPTLYIVNFEHPLNLRDPRLPENKSAEMMREGIFAWAYDPEEAYFSMQRDLDAKSFDLISWQTLKIGDEAHNFISGEIGCWRKFSINYIGCNK